MTFSIVAWDPGGPAGAEWGVGVASKFLASAAVVSWARAGAGAVATQAFSNVAYGPEGLARLGSGEAAAEVIEAVTRPDPHREERQVGIVDREGRAASFTGSACFDWAGSRVGEGYAVQGNILVGPEVIRAMSGTFESADGDLGRRILEALQAGDAAGGDRRGRQSAGLLLVREGGGYGGGTDLVIDLRVDDHPRPVAELERLLGLHEAVFPRPGTLAFQDIGPELATEIRSLLRNRGFAVPDGSGFDQALREALFRFVGWENLEERWHEGPLIEATVLEMLRGNMR